MGLENKGCFKRIGSPWKLYCCEGLLVVFESAMASQRFPVKNKCAVWSKIRLCVTGWSQASPPTPTKIVTFPGKLMCCAAYENCAPEPPKHVLLCSLLAEDSATITHVIHLPLLNAATPHLCAHDWTVYDSLGVTVVEANIKYANDPGIQIMYSLAHSSIEYAKILQQVPASDFGILADGAVSRKLPNQASEWQLTT